MTIGLKRSVIMCVLLAAYLGLSTRKASAQNYPIDATVTVLLNWDTFEDEGFPSNWKGPVTDAVINAYTNWNQIGGARVYAEWGGYTTLTDATGNQLVITATESHFSSGRVGSCFGKKVVIHRAGSPGGTPHNFVPYRGGTGEWSMQAVLVHEMGHCLADLPHATDFSEHPEDRQAMAGGSGRGFWGPYPGDQERFVANYGDRGTDILRTYRSTDGGATYASFGDLHTRSPRTTMRPGTARESSSLLTTYTTPSKRPAWIVGSATTGVYDGVNTFYGSLNSFYGTGAAADGSERLWTFVDHANSDNLVRVLRSTNSGSSWAWRNPPTSNAIGTPDICHITGNTWVLVYPRVDWSTYDLNWGAPYARVTTDDGLTWSSEIDVSRTLYRTNQGVSCSSKGSGSVAIGLSWASRSLGPNTRLRTLIFEVSGSSLIYDEVIIENEYSRTEPSLADNSQSYLQRLFRGTNGNTSAFTSRAPYSPVSWTLGTSLQSVQAVAGPSVAADRGLSYVFATVPQ